MHCVGVYLHLYLGLPPFQIISYSNFLIESKDLKKIYIITITLIIAMTLTIHFKLHSTL